jgi:hypothetical protein
MAHHSGMRYLNRWPLLIPLILAPMACSKPRFAYEVDATFHQASYQTVAPDPRTDRVFIREGLRPLDPSLHRQAALAELQARNYRPAPPDASDLWVNVVVMMKAGAGGHGEGSSSASHREGSGAGHRGGGGRGSMGGGGASKAGKEGGGSRADRGSMGGFTVIVQLEDRKTGRVVWQGEVEPGSGEHTPDGKPPSIEATMHQLLQPLPTLRN